MDWNEKIEKLNGLADTLESILRKVDDGILRMTPYGGGWSPIEIAGHLRDVTEVFDQRIRRMLREDNPALRAFDQEAYVRDANYADMPLAALTDAIRNDRQDLAALLGGLDEGARARKAVRTNGTPTTVEETVDTLVRHDEAHVADIRAAVGG